MRRLRHGNLRTIIQSSVSRSKHTRRLLSRLGQQLTKTNCQLVLSPGTRKNDRLTSVNQAPIKACLKQINVWGSTLPKGRQCRHLADIPIFFSSTIST